MIGCNQKSLRKKMIKIGIFKRFLSKGKENNTGNVQPSNNKKGQMRTNLAKKQEDLNELMKKLKEKYEKSSQIASTNPILDECTHFYNEHFDARERAIGITFIKEKIIPRAVPDIKQAINDLAIEQDLEIYDILSDKYFSMLLDQEVESRSYLIRTCPKFYF